MHITLTDANAIRLKFSYSLTNVDFVKSLGGEYNKPSKTWTVSLCHLRKILDRWPNATFDDLPATVAARLAMWRRWVHSHNAMGVWFGYDVDGETVTCAGPGVSPALIEAVNARSSILRQFLGDQLTPCCRPVAPAPEPTHNEALLRRSVENAQRAEEKREEMLKRVKKQRYQKRQSAQTDDRSLGGTR